MTEQSQSVYISLGSNLLNPMQQVTQAIAELNDIKDCSVKQVSPWYLSEAVGPGEQPDYINGVAELSVSLNPYQLLEQLQIVEKKHNRERGIRWGARTLDLDILLFGNVNLSNEDLEIPHPRLSERNFVILPLFDIAPHLILPNGKTLKQLVENCTRTGIQRSSHTDRKVFE